MTSGIYKKVILRLKKQVGRRPKDKWNKLNGGVIYLPTDTIGHKVKIEVLEK